MSLPHFAILAPIPLEHLESGKPVADATGYVAFGTSKWELFQKIDTMRQGARVAVLIYPSWGKEAADTGLRVSWFGWYHGHTHSKSGAHPDGLEHRPPSTANYAADNFGHWAAFWHVSGLRQLPKSIHLPISNIGTTKGGWRKDAPPRGPELVALPEVLSYISTQPTLNRLADDRAKTFPEHEVNAEIVKVLGEDAKIKGGFYRVFAAPDDPTSIDEAEAVSLVILSPSTPHSGKGVLKSPATDGASDALMRCRASQRRFRNTLLFIAPDEAQLGNAREVMRKALAWKSIVDDDRVQQQLTQGQATDASDKAKSNRESAQKAVRGAWSHILYPVKSDAAGKPFELEHSLISARERSALPSMVYDKAKADGIVLEKLGTERLWLALKPIWPEDRPHLSVSEVADWFAAYVYLPRLRDRVVLETAIRDAVAKLDAQFGYADAFDEAAGQYRKLVWAQVPPEILASTAVLVREAEAKQQLSQQAVPIPAPGGGAPSEADPREPGTKPSGGPQTPSKPRRFYGSVELDMVRPVKSFDAILNAVVMELQRTQGAKVKLTLEVEAEAAGGFDDSEIGVVRDNARQLKFKAEATGFEN